MEYWKFKAIDRLKSYRAQKAALETLPEEIAALEYEARSIRSASADSVAVKGGGSAREDRLLSNIVDREEHKAMLERAQRSVRGVERGLGVLNDAERHLLDVMYITGGKGKVQRLMDELGLQDDASVYRRVNAALIKFTVAMYGSTES